MSATTSAQTTEAGSENTDNPEVTGRGGGVQASSERDVGRTRQEKVKEKGNRGKGDHQAIKTGKQPETREEEEERAAKGKRRAGK